MPRILKPQRLEDIQRERGTIYRSSPRRLNLNRNFHRSFPVGFFKLVSIFVIVWFLILGSATAPTYTNQIFAASTDEERQALQKQLDDLEAQIDTYEDQIASYQKQGSSLKGEISRLNSKIAKLNLQIQAINLTLSQLDLKITETQYQINSTEESIASNREALVELLKAMYENDQAGLMEIFLKNARLSDFFSNLNNIALTQANIRSTITKITALKDQLNDQKEQYSLARADAATLKNYQLAQKTETDQVKKQKNTILAATQGQEAKYQSLLKETKQTAAQIRNRLFELLGGGALTFEKAYEYAKMASDLTGVRPALLLAVLDRESALGKNVGRCSYKTAMSPKNQPIFLEITSKLGLDPNTTFVSCPNADGVYGGAMGPAQFIPSTWMLYTDEISKLTGRNPASPWNNIDAFVATALYLRDAGAVSSSISQERIAAAKYYAGGSWSRYLWTYGQAVINRAQQFQEDIATISG